MDFEVYKRARKSESARYKQVALEYIAGMDGRESKEKQNQKFTHRTENIKQNPKYGFEERSSMGFRKRKLNFRNKTKNRNRCKTLIITVILFLKA